jgi:glycerophosphoryl diester phosphodiesterase
MNPGDSASVKRTTSPAAQLRGIVRRTFADLWRVLPDLLWYSLVFAALSFAVLSPLVAWLVNRFAATSGKAAVGNFDIITFLATPQGLTIGMAILTLSLALLFADVAGLIAISFGAAQQRRVSYSEALRFVAVRLGRLLRASFATLLILILAALPFVLAIAGVAWWKLSEHDINFYLDVQPPEFWSAVRWGAVLATLGAATAIFVSVPLMFVLPVALLEGLPLRRAITRSFQLATGNRQRILLLLVAWLGLWQLVSLLVNGAVYALGHWLVYEAGDRLTLLVPALGGVTALSVLGNVAVATAATLVGSGLLAHLYLDACQRRGLATEPFAHLPSLADRPQWKLSRRTPFVLSLVAIGIAAFAIWQVLENVEWEDHVGNSAHRGASLAKPENTLGAVRRAIEDGATHIEIDVQRTSDGQIVLAHDADMMRLAGSPLVIHEATWDELRKLEFRGERVCTLDEVIDLTKGKAKLLVETKSYRDDPDRLVTDVVEVLRRREILDDTLAMSLSYREARKFKELEPRLKVGLTTTVRLGDLARLELDFFAIQHTKATNALIAATHAQGREVFVWTVNDRGRMATMIDRGVDNIITDDPALLTQLLEERNNLEPAERLLLRFKGLYGR